MLMRWWPWREACFAATGGGGNRFSTQGQAGGAIELDNRPTGPIIANGRPGDHSFDVNWTGNRINMSASCNYCSLRTTCWLGVEMGAASKWSHPWKRPGNWPPMSRWPCLSRRSNRVALNRRPAPRRLISVGQFRNRLDVAPRADAVEQMPRFPNRSPNKPNG